MGLEQYRVKVESKHTNDFVFASILDGIDSSWSTIEKAKYIHDVICRVSTYDERFIFSSNPELLSAIYNKEINVDVPMIPVFICKSFNEIYSELLNRIGIRNRIISKKSTLNPNIQVEDTALVFFDESGNAYLTNIAADIQRSKYGMMTRFFGGRDNDNIKPDDPFTWASGIKSPIYCDNRLTLSAPKVRDEIEEGLAQIIKENYPEVEILMGTSTAGIPHAAITAYKMNLPMGYVRGSSKDHGRKNQIEGKLEKGQKVVVIEDLISTGGSVIDVVDVLRDAGADVLGIASIFTYNMQKSKDRLEEANVKNVSLSNFDVLVEVAAEEGYIKQEDIQRLIKFRNNPSDESWRD